MALSRKLSKAEYDAVKSADIKAEYKLVGEDYMLDTEDLEDTGPLKRANERQKTELTTAKAKVTELEGELEEAKSATGNVADEVKKATDKLQKRYDKDTGDLTAKNVKYEGMLKQAAVDNVALEIANRISTAPKLMLPHIKARLQADLDGDSAATTVLDDKGQPTTLSVAALEKELAAQPDFKAILKASSASGGGAGQGGSGGGASGKKFGDLTERERVELYNADPAEFQRQSDAHRQLPKK